MTLEEAKSVVEERLSEQKIAALKTVLDEQIVETQTAVDKAKAVLETAHEDAQNHLDTAEAAHMVAVANRNSLEEQAETPDVEASENEVSN